MTDKEIIIDGIDVSGCEHLTDQINGCWLSTADYLPYKGNITNQLCKYNDNCYYKQLKQLEQENAELRALVAKRDESVTAQAEIILNLKQEIAELKAENYELKESLKVFQKPDIIKLLTDYRTGELGLLEEKYNTLINKFFNSETNNYKYKQTLQEIKETADAKCNECKYGKDEISCKYGDCGEAKLHLITHLITKAEEE